MSAITSDKNEVKKNIYDPKLPWDIIIVEILSRLPPKSLVRFQLVCKEWREFIYSPHFREKYKDVCPTPEKYLNNTRDFQRENLMNNNISQGEELLSLICGCDGLILFCTCSTPRKYSLRNPAICRVLELPDPCNHNYGFSLSFIPSTQNYRIVTTYNEKQSGESGFQVFTPGSSKTWRNLRFPDDIQVDGFERFRLRVVVAGEVAHCVRVFYPNRNSTISSTVIDIDQEVQVVSLDIGTEVFTVNSLPKGRFFHDWRTLQPIGWDDEKLALVEVVGENLHVIKLEDHKKHQWGEKKAIPLPFLKKETVGDHQGNLIPLFSKQGEIWFWLYGQKIFTYSVGTGQVRDLKKLEAFSSSKNFFLHKPSMLTFEGMKPDTLASSNSFLRYLMDS